MTTKRKMKRPPLRTAQPEYEAGVCDSPLPVSARTFIDTLEDCAGRQSMQALRIEEVHPSLSDDSAPFLRPKPTALNSIIGESAWRTLQKILSQLRRRCVQRSMKKLRVSESVSLGEKRFVAILQVENRKYLIGGGAANVALLTQLEDTSSGTPQRSTLSANVQDISCARGVN
jgi:hypothetical protein